MTTALTTKRDFLKVAATAGLASVPGWRLAANATTAPDVPPRLTAAPTQANLLRDAEKMTSVWGYNGGVPGPVLRVMQGTELALTLDNQLDQPTSVHWHGIRIDNRMDGVPGLTQEAVLPGSQFDYRFTLPDAGTYWYHSHMRSFEQVARGLYGPLIIEESEPYDVDRDIVLLIDDWSIQRSGPLADADIGNMHDISHGGRLGNWLTVNGEADHQVNVIAGQRLRLRLANTANARILPIGFTHQPGWIVALDGQPLAQPSPVKDVLQLAPGQRADIVLDMTQAPGSEATMTFRHRDDVFDIVYFKYDAKESVKPRQEPPEALPPNPLSTALELADRVSVDLVIAGGAMGSMQSAKLGDKELGIRELVKQGYAWSLNGEAGMPDEPVFSVRRGQTVSMRMQNDTRWPHAMHVHGHHFKAGEPTDAALSKSPWRDTVTVEQSAQTYINFVADNPGKWLLHCHMLEHAAGGMMTWFEVT